jgi:hypothetical protein
VPSAARCPARAAQSLARAAPRRKGGRPRPGARRANQPGATAGAGGGVEQGRSTAARAVTVT